jgi:hypothetical protein
VSDPHEPVGRTEYVVSLEREVDQLRASVEAVAKALGHEPGVNLAEEARLIIEERNETMIALRGLLAVIHRDGGHHTAFAGTTQSVKDAHAAWGKTMRELDELRSELKQKNREHVALKDTAKKAIAYATASYHEAKAQAERLRVDRRHLRRSLAECRPWVGVCPTQPDGIRDMCEARDSADKMLEEVPE